VFGSVARGEARPDSDVDLLVELNQDEACSTWAAVYGFTTLLGREVMWSPTRGLPRSDSRSSLREARPL